MQAQSM
ncbi:putative hemoglobin and hemoglobin-haptoglobin-binding protein 3 precursor, partial [Haemophilus influenzae]